MAYTQEQLDALDEAIASGALEVQYKDKKITYRSQRDMMQLRDFMARKLGQKKSDHGVIYPRMSKGFNRRCGNGGFDGQEK